MAKAPKVSVLTPIYNTNIGHLCECIESILNQTFTDFEFIILNDSPENKRLAKVIGLYNDPRIKYYENKKNIGISASRNRLLELARGEYIAIFDHDDISMPDRLARQVEFLDTHPNVGVVSSLMQCFGDRNDVWKLPEHDIEIKIALTDNCFVAHTAAMIRKSVLDTNNIKYEEKYTPAEDYRLWTRLMGVTDFYNIQDTLVHYRWHATNTSISQNVKMELARLTIKTDVATKYLGYRMEFESIKNASIQNKTKDWRMRLLGIIPFLKRKSSWILLFDFLPIIKIKD